MYEVMGTRRNLEVNMMSVDFEIYNKPHWIVSGEIRNFEYSIEYKQIWGVQDKWFSQWKALERDDILFFYITQVKRIVAVGRVENKFIQREPLWPDEIEEGIVKYPFRFEFTLFYSIDKKKWQTEGINLPQFISQNFGKGAFADLLRGGINFIRYKNIIDFLYENFEKTFQFKTPIQEPKEISTIGTIKITTEGKESHAKLKDLVYKIGIMNKFLSVREYPMNSENLDVVWRRIEKGSPTYVFEVQVGGDIYHALGKLKHAFDLWNSNIFLVVAFDKDIHQANKLLNGTFHEIKDKIKIIPRKKIEELYKRKLSWVEYEKELGIL